MSARYFIHQIEHWNGDELLNIKAAFGDKYEQDVDAAKGEGAGGAGFDTLVEFLFTNPIASGVLAAAVYDIVKVLVKHKPGNRPKAPSNVPSQYRLAVHTRDGIIGINLDDDVAQIKIALNNTPHLSDLKASRAYQNGENWDIF